MIDETLNGEEANGEEANGEVGGDVERVEPRGTVTWPNVSRRALKPDRRGDGDLLRRGWGDSQFACFEDMVGKHRR